MIKNSFFRQKALEHYQQNQVPRVVPKFVSPFIIFLCWILSFVFIAGAISVWSYNTPLFAQGSGIIRNVAASALSGYGVPDNEQQAKAIAILLFPDQIETQLHTGNSVQIEGMQHSLSGTIERLDTTLPTLDAIRQRYNLSDDVLPNISSSDFVALVGFGTTTVSSSENDKHVTANVQIGSQNILHLFLIAHTGTG